MKKIAKLSLVASLAIAASAANAQELTEAIKNVDVSGTVVYRYNDYDSGTHQNQYQIATNVSSKVNDDVTANTRFRIGNVSLDTNSTGDSNVDVKLSEVNFAYTGVKGLSLTVGKQAIATPWTVARDSNGNESTGTGAVAAYTAGPVTLVGAYFNQTNLDETIDGEVGFAKVEDANGNLIIADGADADTNNDNEVAAVKDALGSADIYVLGAMASFAGINLDAFYANLDEQFDSYTVGLDASYNVGSVALSPFARYTALEADKNSEVAAVIGTDKQKLWQLGLGAKMGMFSAFAAYGESGKDGGMVFLDSGSKVNMDYHWRITANGSADAEYLYVHTTADVTDKVNVGLFYSEADYKTANDKNEIYVQAKYKMSSNLYTYVRLGQLDEDGESKVDMGRLHVQYSF